MMGIQSRNSADVCCVSVSIPSLVADMITTLRRSSQRSTNLWLRSSLHQTTWAANRDIIQKFARKIIHNPATFNVPAFVWYSAHFHNFVINFLEIFIRCSNRLEHWINISSGDKFMNQNSLKWIKSCFSSQNCFLFSARFRFCSVFSSLGCLTN